jgi:type IV pilus assembly protein PilE
MEKIRTLIKPMRQTSLHRAGFTLIELMITVAIVAILATIATASYQSVMAKGDRATAISDIVEISQSLERYYSFNRTYTNDFRELAMAPDTAFADTVTDAASLYDYYIGIPGTTAVDSVPQGQTNGLSYAIYAKPTSKNRDTWTLSYNELGFKTYYASGGSTTVIDGWP